MRKTKFEIKVLFICLLFIGGFLSHLYTYAEPEMQEEKKQEKQGRLF